MPGLGWILCRGRLYEKGVWNRLGKQAFPTLPSPFFCALCALAELCSADCRSGAACVWLAPFFLRKKRAGFALRRGMGNAACGSRPPVPLVSPQRNGGPPRALPHIIVAGPDGTAVRARAARRKRERRPPGRACSQPWNPLSFSISLPNQPNQRLAFGESSRGSFGLQSCPLERPPYTS